MTCHECGWLVLISKSHLHKGEPQTGFCKRKCERVAASDDACKDFGRLNENVGKAREVVARYNKTRRKAYERTD